MCNQNIRAFKAITLAIGIYFLLVNNSYAQEKWNLQLESPCIWE